MSLDDETITLEIVERELGVQIPDHVAEAVDRFREIDSDSWCSLISPQRLLCRNLEERLNRQLWMTKAGPWTSSITPTMLIVGDDGCGNYWIVDVAEELRFGMWNHEVNRIDDADLTFAQYVDQEVAVILPPGGEPFRWNPTNEIILHRTRLFRDSALHPISLDEWRSAVGLVDGVEMMEKREMKDPFTNQIRVLEKPGFARITSGEQTAGLDWWTDTCPSRRERMRSKPSSVSLSRYSIAT